MEYLYETHLHTREASACASLSGAQQVRLYKKLGYTGIIVTDHFFGGNTCIPRDIPWQEKIELFCLGYEHAKKEGEKIGLSVFFGLETNFRGTEFLLYGVGKEWLLSHPQMLNWSVADQYREVKAVGGMVVHAHPFREANYLPKAKVYPDFVDAVEGYNFGNRNPKFNELAIQYAKQYNKPLTGGGDAHNLDSGHGGICVKQPWNSVKDYIEIIIKKEKYQILHQSKKLEDETEIQNF